MVLALAKVKIGLESHFKKFKVRCPQSCLRYHILGGT